MKAIIYKNYGSPIVIVPWEIEKPSPKDHEVLIKIKATTVTSADCMMRRGDTILSRILLGLFRPRKKFRILGTEFPGIIESIGQNVKGYYIPVLNEREIRAAAGILFLATFLSLMFILFKENFIPIKYVITLFLFDFLIRVFINPKFSPTLILARLIVRNQTPEYVGARQKKFAWIIGVLLSATMFFYFNIVNAYSPITGIICLICLIFLFFESAFGICLGCLFYPIFFKGKAQYCPGEVCDVKQKQDIQKTSKSQFFVLLAFVAFTFLLVFFMNKRFSEKPHALFGGNKTEQHK